MAGLLEMFAPDAVSSPLYQAFDDNRYTLSNMLLGGVGKQGADRLSGMAQSVTQTNDMRQKIAMQKQIQQQELNKSLEYLKGTNPQLAQMAQAGAPLDTVWQAAMSQSGAMPTEYSKRAEAAKQYGIDPNSTEGKSFILSGALPPSVTGKGQYGLNPIFGRDAQGNPVVLQMSSTGQMGQAQMPPGVSLSKEPIKLDTGDSYTLLDPITRQTISVIPKNLAGAEQQKVVGKGAAEAQLQLPGTQQMVDQIDSLISDIKNDPGTDNVLGTIYGRTPNIFPGAVRAQSKINQLQGGAFLQARQLLKGAGAITDFEGKKAEQAFVRLDQAQSKKDFFDALDEFNYWVKQGLLKLQNQASMGSSPQGSNNHTVGDTSPQIDNLLKKYGGM